MDNNKLEFVMQICGVDEVLANRLVLLAESRSEKQNITFEEAVFLITDTDIYKAKSNKERLLEVGYTEKHLQSILNKFPNMTEEVAFACEIKERTNI